MKTKSKLLKAYKNAKIMDFDEHSRYIIFSDAHRSDGSRSDEFTRNQNIFMHALSYYYKNGFTLIEAGDGDELWEHPEFRFIRKAHYQVYDWMKKFYDEGRLEILYGNHNIYLRNEEYLKKFLYTYFNDAKEETMEFLDGLKPCEALLLNYKKTGQGFLVLHGHQGDLFNDQLWIFSMLSLKFLWKYIHAIGATSPASPVKSITRQHKIEKNYLKWIEEYKTAIICGHTHRYKFPGKDELPYFNTGCCIYPDNITGIEIADGEAMIVRWKVMPNESGILKIERYVIRGPMPIESFTMKK